MGSDQVDRLDPGSAEAGKAVMGEDGFFGIERTKAGDTDLAVRPPRKVGQFTQSGGRMGVPVPESGNKIA